MKIINSQNLSGVTQSYEEGILIMFDSNNNTVIYQGLTIIGISKRRKLYNKIFMMKL